MTAERTLAAMVCMFLAGYLIGDRWLKSIRSEALFSAALVVIVIGIAARVA